MATIIKERVTPLVNHDFVIFLIGMRINRWWAVHQWAPVLRAMGGMLKELQKQPVHGLLNTEFTGLGNPVVLIQYWQSVEHLNNYARNRQAAHFPAWKAFYKRSQKNGAVGIWHETYPITKAQYEAIYLNMPPFGLGKVGPLVPAHGPLSRAAGRMGALAIQETQAPASLQKA